MLTLLLRQYHNRSPLGVEERILVDKGRITNNHLIDKDAWQTQSDGKSMENQSFDDKITKIDSLIDELDER